EQGEAFEYPVANGVAVGVVDLLEVVDIHHDKGERIAALLGLEDFRFQQVQGMGVVIQACQAVADHQGQQGPGPASPVVDGGYQVARVDGLGEEVVASQAHGM